MTGSPAPSTPQAMLSVARIAVRIITLLAACVAPWQPVLALHCTCKCACCTTAAKQAGTGGHDEGCQDSAQRQVTCRCCKASKKSPSHAQPKIGILGFSPCQCPPTCPCREQHRPDPQIVKPTAEVGQFYSVSAAPEGTVPVPVPAITRDSLVDATTHDWQSSQLCISLCRLTI